jgi:hypothetical protein
MLVSLTIRYFFALTTILGWLGLIIYGILLITKYRNKPDIALLFRGKWGRALEDWGEGS